LPTIFAVPFRVFASGNTIDVGVPMKRILLLPFCLSRQVQNIAKTAAAEEEYTVVVARSTAKALAEVRRHTKCPDADPHMRIVGVVCLGRAKKVWAALVVMKVWQWMKRLLCRRVRTIELAWVPVLDGSRSLFGRRQCHIGQNEPDLEKLRRALQGHDTYMRL
jgi:hypothetical protein